MKNRKLWAAGAAVLVAGGVAFGVLAGTPEARGTEVRVVKSPTCGCCNAWADHLEEEGFAVEREDRQDMAVVKREMGVPADLSSCHTAVVDGYVIEGHVPASAIERLLEERPDVAGLAVPGMPIGSPGMEGARADRYEVIAFDGEGNRRVFARFWGGTEVTGDGEVGSPDAGGR